MPTTKKSRRPYDPSRWLARTQAAQQKRLDAAPLLPDQQRDLGLNVWLSFELMTKGGSEIAWHNLASTLNIAMRLAEVGIGAEYLSDITKAQDALVRIDYRQRRTGSWAFDAEGMAAVQAALEIHDEQMKLAERGEVRSAINEVNKRLKSGDVLQMEMRHAAESNHA